jgi:hypothetical protein
MRWVLSIIGIAALALLVSSNVEAAPRKDKGIVKSSNNQIGPKQNSYGRGMRAHWGSGCKMSGSC